jgi:predicted ATPase/transcriptional regulator with XRE-family HTH domain
MATVQPRSFGELLKRYRVASGLSQEALAERARLSTRAISDLERGVKQTPRRDTVELLAAALQLSREDYAALEAAVSRRKGPLSAAAPPAPEQSHPLPAQLTPLLGRTQDVAAVAGLLRQEHVRLLTLTGPSGVGKTRLGLEVAAILNADYADGVVLVSLAAIRDPDLVASTIGQTVGLRDAGDRPLREHLAAYLRDKRLLLVLDNFEQVLAAASLVVDLLAACPILKVLVTSRAALRVRGEHEFPVSPLALPDPARRPDVTTLAQNPAVDLFIQRARAVQPDFDLTVANAATVAEICRRLDGLPLAIELAAARVKLLPPEALLARLKRRLQVLTGGARDLPARQHTMRSAIAWSYDLLEAREQRLFRRLAVFAGGGTLEAVAAVCGAGAPGGSTTWDGDILDGLASLMDKSLLRRVAGQPRSGSEPRFGMLETIREYGLACLAAAGEMPALQGGHATYFLTLVEDAAPRLIGAGQVAELARLEDERDNLRAALRWALDSGEVELGLRLAVALWPFWWVRGHLSEGRRWLEGLLVRAARGEGTAPVAPSARAGGLNWAGALAASQGDYRRAVELSEEGLALCREIGDRSGSAFALNSLGTVAQYQGDYERAAAFFADSLALYQELGDRWGRALVLNNLGAVAHYQGDNVRATALYEQSLAIARELGEQWRIATALDNLGEVAHDHGDYERMALLSEESLALRRELGDVWGIADSLNSLGLVMREWGNYERATALYEECLTLYRHVGDRWGSAVCLEGLAAVASAQGQPERAVRLVAAAAALREAIGAPLSPADQAGYDRTVADLRATLGADPFAAAWALGRTLPLEQVATGADVTRSEGVIPPSGEGWDT